MNKNNLDYYSETFGTGTTNAVGDLPALESELKSVENEMSIIKGQIYQKTAELESIKTGEGLSDIEMAAREEYTRTGSSAAMQNVENNKANKEAISKEKEQEASADAESYAFTLKQLFARYKDQGNTLSNEDKEKAMSAWTSLKKISGKRGPVENDENNNGIEDDVEKVALLLSSSETTSSSKKSPMTFEELQTALSQQISDDDKKSLINGFVTKMVANQKLSRNTNGSLNEDSIPEEWKSTLLPQVKEAGHKVTSGRETAAQAAANAEKEFKNSVLEKLRSKSLFVSRAKKGLAKPSEWESVISDISNLYVTTKNKGRVDKSLIESLLKEFK